MPKKIAVIGLGNPLRRDDGIGILILASLGGSNKIKGVDYLDFGIASFDLLSRVRDYDIALLIDAVDASIASGELRIFGLEEIDNNLKDDKAISSHEIGLKKIFELSKALGIKTKIYVAGIQVHGISYGEGLSEALQDKFSGITREISGFIDKIAGEKR